MRCLYGGSELFYAEDDGTDIVPLLKTKLVFFFKKDKFPDGVRYENLSDLSDQRIGDLRGSPQVEIFKENGIKIEFANEIIQNFKKLEANRVDLIICSDLSGLQIVKDFFPDSIDDFDMTEESLYIIDDGIIFLKEKEEMVNKFKKGLEVIKENGTYQKIVDKYYNLK